MVSQILMYPQTNYHQTIPYKPGTIEYYQYLYNYHYHYYQGLVDFHRNLRK